MKKALPILLAALLLFVLTGCGRGQDVESVSKTSLKLDTVVTITLYDWTDPAPIDLAFAEIDRLEALLSVEKEGSDLDRLTKAAGKEWVEISPETEEVLRTAQKYSVLSEGHFDVTAGPLIDLWNIHDGEGHYPTSDELAATLPLIQSSDLQIEDGKAFLARDGMKANLGAIAKGYIADRVKSLLMEQGVEHAVLDLGRNILLIGGKTEDTDFIIGVQDPNEEQSVTATVLAVRDKSLVTSGIDERYFTYEGKNYHHILDPFTGFPADNGLASVTILSDSSVDGDALSTTCLLLGEEKGMALIEGLDGIEALFITETGERFASSGFDTYLAE